MSIAIGAQLGSDEVRALLGTVLITVPVDDATSASMTLLQNWMPSPTR